MEVLGKIGFDWQVAVANLVNFLLIAFIVWRFFFKPLAKTMKKRREIIEEGVERAEESERVLDESKIKSEVIIREARNEAKTVVQDSVQTANEKRRQIEAETQTEVARMLENSKKALKQEQQKMLDESRHHIAELASSMAHKALEVSVDDTVEKKIVEGAVKKINKETS